MKKVMIIMLAALMVFSCTACGTEKNTETNADNTPLENTVPVGDKEAESEPESEPEETTRDQIRDGLPEKMDLGGEAIRFILVPECAPYDAVGDDSGGDVIFDSVYNRNLHVEDRLNAKLDFTYYGVGNDHAGLANEITQIVMANTSELYAVLQRGFQAFNLSLQGVYMNLNDSQYIDPTQPWWNSGNKDISINSDKSYFLLGDITLSPFLFSTTCFFNKALMNNLSLDVNELYKTVQNGKWTLDVWREYCQAASRDIDGDGETTANDQCGFMWASNENYYTRSAGLYFISRDEEGYPVLAINNEKTVELTEKLVSILHDPTCAVSLKNVGPTAIPPYFSSGLNLFFMGRMAWVTSLYEDNLRSMEDPYGMIPFPKLSESEEYMAGTGATSGNLVAVPITCPNYEGTAMMIEAMCAESYRIVFPAMYETALKAKYSDENIDSQMVDLIHDSIYNDFSVIAGLDILIDGLVREGSANFASKFASEQKTIESNLNAMIDAYKSLD